MKYTVITIALVIGVIFLGLSNLGSAMMVFLALVFTVAAIFAILAYLGQN